MCAGAVAVSAFGLQPVATAEPAASTEPTPPKIELVLDLSGSMKENDAGGQTRLAAAKQAADRVIDTAPETAQIGIRVYGATYAGDDKATGCADTQVLIPVGPLGTADAKAAAKQKVAGMTAVGFTPIGKALRAAATDLGTQGDRHVILVSDGEDTCAPPQPCDVAKELNAQGVKLRIDAVGFNVSGAAREQLKCIARSSGGAYADAGDAQSLVTNMSTLFRKAWTPYDAVGTPIKGSTTGCQNAPLVEPGQYLDGFVTSRDLWYKIRKSPDEDIQISATAIFALRMRESDAREDTAYLTHLYIRSGPPGQEQSWMVREGVGLDANNVVSIGGRSGETNHTPAPDDLGCVKISHNAEVDPAKALPLELLIGRSQRVAEPDAEPAPRPSTSSRTTSPPAAPSPVEAEPAADSDDDGPNTGLTITLIAVAVLAGAALGSFVAGSGRAARRQS